MKPIESLEELQEQITKDGDEMGLKKYSTEQLKEFLKELKGNTESRGVLGRFSRFLTSSIFCGAVAPVLSFSNMQSIIQLIEKELESREKRSEDDKSSSQSTV